MANTFTPTFSENIGGNQPNLVRLVRGVLTIDTTANGGAAAGDLPATMFGLNRILVSTPAIAEDDGDVFTTSPSADGASLMVGPTIDEDSSTSVTDLPNDTYVISLIGI